MKEDALPEDTAVIQSVKVKTFGEDGLEREINMADKIKALKFLDKHMGMFKEKLDVKTPTCEKLDDIMSQMRGESLEE